MLPFWAYSFLVILPRQFYKPNKFQNYFVLYNYLYDICPYRY